MLMETSAERRATMDVSQAKALLEAASVHLGREITVTVCRAALREKDREIEGFVQTHEEEPDDFYEFTQEDYARLVSSKKPDIYLKTKKIRDAEEASRRARLNKAIVRVQFPDNYILEAKFHPSDALLSLFVLLKKVLSQTDLPFYLYTTPPKQRLEDMNKDFYTLGLVPGGLVHFAYDLPKGMNEDEQSKLCATPYLASDFMALQDLHLLIAPVIDPQISERTVSLEKEEQHLTKRPGKTGSKPKWLKL